MIKTYLHKRENGIWYVIIRYIDQTGKEKSKWVSTKRKSKSEATLLVKDIQKKYAYLDHGEVDIAISVSDYLSLWKEKQRDKVDISSFESYHTYFDKHLIPDFAVKNILLRDLSAKDIKDYVDYLQHFGRIIKPTTSKRKKTDEQEQKEIARGLSLEMTRKIISLFKKALDDAVIDGYIDSNPGLSVKVTEVKGAGITQTKNVLHTVDECQAVLDAFQDHPLQPIVYLTLYYGFRRSEILGLKWDAIDFENETITIKHTIVKCQTVVAKDATKTRNSRATMRMLPEIKEILLEIKKKEAQNREFFGKQYVENDYVFKHEDGRLYYPDCVTGAFKKVLKKHNLPDMRFHDLRKSTASWLFNAGWDINSVREWLRHADIETTANIYTEISRQKVKELGDSITNTFHV